jgi:hypothetical protein
MAGSLLPNNLSSSATPHHVPDRSSPFPKRENLRRMERDREPAVPPLYARPEEE